MFLLVDARVPRWPWILAIIHSFFLPFLRDFFLSVTCQIPALRMLFSFDIGTGFQP
jgi:hypothetical protein